TDPFADGVLTLKPVLGGCLIDDGHLHAARSILRSEVASLDRGKSNRAEVSRRDRVEICREILSCPCLLSFRVYGGVSKACPGRQDTTEGAMAGEPDVD